MNPRSLFSRWLLAPQLLLAVVDAARATPFPPSDPVGSLHLVLRGASDTIVSLPLHRPALIESAAASRSGNQIILAAPPGSLPAEGAFALVQTGALEGSVLPVTSLTGSAVTIDATGFDLSSLHTAAANVTGDVIALIPYWTLDTVFPAGANIHPSTDLLSVQTQILLFNDATPGVNLSASATYFYYAGDGFYSAGWYRFGAMSATAGLTRLPPNHYFIVRHPAATATTDLVVTGQVQMSGACIPLATRAANRGQDNLVALPVPVPVTLANSRLTESGAFTPTTDLLSVTDQLLVFNNAALGPNKSASAVYFYFSGNGFYAAGWYRFGDMTQTVGNVSLKPGEGYVIRKAATTVAQTNFWALIPTYLQ